jgi:hypothetical protein
MFASTSAHEDVAVDASDPDPLPPPSEAIAAGKAGRTCTAVGQEAAAVGVVRALSVDDVTPLIPASS